ncbi:unnamed protein product [Fraxinus pennsylvanica]|uniref:PGG domain-containing protein n=1 Tax=Fraxinus pennsylvanica TaxID=56036 RepID=A0AAD1ZB86_9LAMI|nr:unnamed protein product [Fraxinus pennsylvanica]
MAQQSQQQQLWKILGNKISKLNENGETLLLSAVNEAKKGLVNKLVEKIAPDLLAETDNLGNTALHLAAKVGLVEDAKILVKKCPGLLNCENKEGLLPIQLAARREQAIARSMTSMLFKAGKEDDNHSKLLHGEAGAGVGSSVMKSLIKAGFYDLALDLLEFNEKLAWEEENISPLEQMANDKKHSIFHVAVMYRHENILKMAHEKNKQRKETQNPDSLGNTLLHLVGSTPRQAGIDTDAGAIFQMQNELQWFKKVSELVTPQELNSENEQKMIPFALFQVRHAAMAANEKEWMTGMATASSVAGSLVATVAFAAAFQAPGGNDSNGIPNFSNGSSFMVFAIADALALFSSITSVLTFLSIFTSRYGVRDYLRALPLRVIIGLISMIFSFIFLTIAFSSALFIVFVHKHDLIRVPIVALSCIPVILYAKLQLPSLLAMIKSTFYPSILHW